MSIKIFYKNNLNYQLPPPPPDAPPPDEPPLEEDEPPPKLDADFGDESILRLSDDIERFIFDIKLEYIKAFPKELE